MSFPSTIDTDTPSSGTSLLTSPDHSLRHNTHGSAIVAIENKLGLGSGSAAANRILVGSGAGTSSWGSVWNLAQLGTPTITAGTLANVTIGTPTITGGTTTSFVGTADSNNFSAKSIKSATTTIDLSAATAPSSGQVLRATSATAATWQALSVVSNQAGTTSSTIGTTTSSSYADIVGGSISVVAPATSNIWVQGVIQAYANNATSVEYLAKLIQTNGTVQIGCIPQVTLMTGNRRVMVICFGIDAYVAAGTYTYKLQHRNSDGTTPSFNEGFQLSAVAFPA